MVKYSDTNNKILFKKIRISMFLESFHTNKIIVFYRSYDKKKSWSKTGEKFFENHWKLLFS